MNKFENLKMEDDECITDIHGRIRDIANQAERLDKPITEESLVLKVMRALPEKYKMDVKAIRHSHNVSELKLDEMMGILETVDLDMHDESSRKKGRSKLLSMEASRKLDKLPVIQTRMYPWSSWLCLSDNLEDGIQIRAETIFLETFQGICHSTRKIKRKKNLIKLKKIGKRRASDVMNAVLWSCSAGMSKLFEETKASLLFNLE